MKVPITAFAQALSRAIITINENEVLQQLALLSAAGLFIFLLMPGSFLAPIARRAATRGHRKARRS
jgi:hypothetical protein